MLKPLSIRRKWVCGVLLAGGELLVRVFSWDVDWQFIHALDEDERDFGYFQDRLISHARAKRWSLLHLL